MDSVDARRGMEADGWVRSTTGFAGGLLACVLLMTGCGDIAALLPAESASNAPPAAAPLAPAAAPPSVESAAPVAAVASASGVDLLNVFFSQVDDTATANVHHPASIARACAHYIGAARESLDICVHEFDNEILVDAVLRAARRGVRTRVITESEYMHEAGPRSLSAAGVPVRGDDRSDLMHNKFVVIDGKAVWTGSFNFTENCAYRNNNNGVFINDAKVAANFAAIFRRYWDAKQFGGGRVAGLVPFPVTTLSDGTTVETLFAPHDAVDDRIIAALSRARRSIKFMAFSFTHEMMAAAMLERARAGVPVVGVIETRQNSKYSMFDAFQRQPNCQVLLDGNRYQMHHKVIIIDDMVTITGSFNFSANAARGNNENIVIVGNARIAAAFAAEFAKVHGVATRQLAGRDASSTR